MERFSCTANDIEGDHNAKTSLCISSKLESNPHVYVLLRLVKLMFEIVAHTSGQIHLPENALLLLLTLRLIDFVL